MSPRGKRAAAGLLLGVCSMLIVGCATDGASSPAKSPAASPTPRYNLAGYSASFKQGYADACGSPKRRSDQRYKSDADYQMGWNDGSALCKK